MRKTSSRRAQGPPKSLGQPLHDQYLLSPAYASHTHSPPRHQQQQQMPPNSPLLHTHFRGSTLSAATSNHNSYLDTSMAFSGGEHSQAVEYAYRDDNASVYSTPSMLPPPHPQDRWSPIDHEPAFESWDDSEAYTGITAHSGFAPQNTNDTGSKSVFEADIESSLPAVVISPVLDPGSPTPALQPTRGGKVPIAAPAKFNFSRPGRPPIIPPSDLKRQVIERNAGRYPAESPPSLSINIPVFSQDMTPGSLPPSSPDGMTKSAPPRDLTQLSTHTPLHSPSDSKSLGNIGPYGLPPSVIPNLYGPRLKNNPQSPNPTSTPEIHGSGLPRNLTPGSSSSTTTSNQLPPPPQQYPRPPGPILSDDHPGVDTSRILVPSGSSQPLGPDTPLRTNPIYQRPARAQASGDPVFSRSMDVCISKSSLFPDPYIRPTPSSASSPAPSPRDSQNGSLKDIDFYDEPSSSEHSSHLEKQQLSHWSMDGASILELPPIVDRDTASPTPSWKWGKKRNKLRKAKKDGNGYEIDGNVSDANKKKGKQKGKEIVILWPEPDSEEPEQLHDSPSEGQSRNMKPMPASLIAADSPAQNFSHPGVVVDDQSPWRSRGFNAREPPSSSLSNPLTWSQQSHHLLEPTRLDVRLNSTDSRSMNIHSMSQPHSQGFLLSPSPFTASQPPLEAMSSNSPLGGNLSLRSPNVGGPQQFQRPPPISLDDPQNQSPFRNTHPYNGLPSNTGPSPISRSPAPSGGRHPELSIDDLPSTSHSLNAKPSSSTSSVPRSLDLNVNGSPLSNYSDFSTSSPEAPSRPSTDTVTGGRRPTIELPRAPPPRTVSPATSVYSQYSFYQLDSASASPINGSTRGSPDSHSSSNLWPQEEPRPPLLSPHYTPPTRSPTAEFGSPSPAYIISPTLMSSRSPHECLQLGIQYHEANRLKDAAICFEKSAKDNGGCGVGMVMWGLTLRHGWGCEKNEVLGFKWLQKAAESAVTDLEGSRKGLDTNAVQVGHNLLKARQGD